MQGLLSLLNIEDVLFRCEISLSGLLNLGKRVWNIKIGKFDAV